MLKSFIDALCGLALCTTCDVINLIVSRYYRYAFRIGRLDLSAQWSGFDIDGILT